MRKIIIVLLIFSSIKAFSQTKNKTEIIIIGTMHDSSAILTPKMLFNILNDVKPDILLQENDSEQIKNYFKEMRPNSNEENASKMYIDKYPNTLNLPFEFEGRNQYRKDHGMVPADILTVSLLDSLYKANVLNNEERIIMDKYNKANEQLFSYLKKDFRLLNSTNFDSINEIRQYIQHKELSKITNKRNEFVEKYIIKPNGEKITYREGFQLWCNFWDLRNNSMAINIIRIANELQGKRIVVLTGVQHKYYLRKLLAEFHDGSFIVKQYYE